MVSLYLCVIVAVCSCFALGASEDDDILQQLDGVLKQIEKVLEARQNDNMQDLMEARDRRFVGAGCRRGQVRCPQARVCIYQHQMCDGRRDCPRSLDERKSRCRNKRLVEKKRSQLEYSSDKVTWSDRVPRRKQCGDHEVPCGGESGKCISRDFLCDGYVDCYGDAWDESSEVCGKMACPKDMIRCNSTDQCIYKEDLCDNIPNCKDHEDENTANCGNRRCPFASTKCPNSNICLENDYWCDGYVDCLEGEDEDVDNCRHIPCEGLRCTDGTCISSSSYCDGYSDCKDGADEDVDRCGPVKCPSGSRVCRGANSCYALSMMCDGIWDCPNGMDERQQDCLGMFKEPGVSGKTSDADFHKREKDRLADLLKLL